MRTITQRTTFPFLIAESGAASFTLAVITSPRPARRPRSPPRGRMHESFRAPLLSATSRIVRIPIIVASLPDGDLGSGGRGDSAAFPDPRSLIPKSRLHIQFRGLRADLCGAAHHFGQPPALQLAEGAAFHDADHIAHLGGALLIVGVELLPPGHNPL